MSSDLRTSIRGFFSLRNSLPGFTFVLLLLLINFRFVLIFIPEYLPLGSYELLGIVLGFLTFLSASALGFLVSQFWHSYLNWRRDKLYEEPYNKLVTDWNIKTDEKNQNKDKMIQETVFSYIIHSLGGDEVGIFNYITRRWDLINTLGSVQVAIILSLLVGYSYWGVMLFGLPCLGLSPAEYIVTSTISKSLDKWTITLWGLQSPPLHHIFILFVSLLLEVIMWRGRVRLFREQIAMSLFIMKLKKGKLLPKFIISDISK